MKKNFLLATMALFMTLFATSCSQEEIISDNDSKGGGTVSVAVNIPVNNPVTRAVPNIPEGYKLRCILQLVKSDDNSNIADGRYVQEVTAGSEKVTFTFNAPSDTYKCLFWADYVKEDVDADNIYTTTDLKAIGYTANAGSEMFNGDVADAFYACSLEPVTGNGALASITLKRPFTKITFKDGQSAYTDYTKITIKDLPAPTGFNVMNGETAGYAGKDAYTDSKISSSELTVENGKWFSAYLFASSNKENLGTDNDIVFELKKADNTSSGELKLNGASITLTENVEVEATVEPKKDGDTSIDVIFPDGMVDPNTLAVGDYILKDGTFSKTYSDQAVAIVFALKNNEIIDNSNYGEEKTPIAYAMAFNETTRTVGYKEGDKAESNTFPTEWTESTNKDWTTLDYSGLSHTNSITTTLSDYASKLFIAGMNTFKQNNAFTKSDNLSDWYIPTARQQLDMFGILLGFNGNDSSPIVPAITKNKTFANAYTQSGKGAYSTEKTELIFMSSTIVTTTGSALTFNLTATTSGSTTLTDYTIKTDSFKQSNMGPVSAVIRPVLTIFEGISKAQ
jgi:hypothetical protein